MKNVTVKNITTNELITENAWMTETFGERFMGLMGKKTLPEGYGLWIHPCNQIHMMNMRLTIDVVYLDEQLKVVAIDCCMKPWTIGKKRPSATSVVEFDIGYIAGKIAIGDVLEIILPQ